MSDLGQKLVRLTTNDKNTGLFQIRPQYIFVTIWNKKKSHLDQSGLHLAQIWHLCLPYRSAQCVICYEYNTGMPDSAPIVPDLHQMDKSGTFQALF